MVVLCNIARRWSTAGAGGAYAGEQGMQVEEVCVMQGRQVEGKCRGRARRRKNADFSRLYSAIGYIY